MSNDDAQREDPTLAADSEYSTRESPTSDPTQSISQSTPATQAIPEWQPPYPGSTETAPPPPPPPSVTAPAFDAPSIQPSAPPTPYPYAGSEASASPAPPPAQPTPPPAAYPGQGQYGQPAQPAYNPPTYGQPAYGPPPPAALPPYSMPGVTYAAQQTNTSAMVLTIISGILTVSCYFTLVGIPSLIIGIVALTKQGTDIAGSRRLSRTGWITMAVVGAIHVLLIAAFITFAVMSDSGASSYDYDSQY